MLPGAYGVKMGAISRRSLLGFGLGAFVLPGVAEGTTASTRARGVILVVLEGGMSQLETWDPKPGAPREIRGEFGTIASSVAGLHVGEHIPNLARELHRGNVLRAVHCDARNDHSPGLHLLLTGYENVAAGVALETTNLRQPSVGAVLAQQLGPTDSRGVPRYVTIPRSTQLDGRVNYNSPSFLGAGCEAFEAGDPPSSARELGQVPPGLVLAGDVSADRFRHRMTLAAVFNGVRADLDRDPVGGQMDDHYRQAVHVLTGRRVQEAFNLDREPSALREAYGDHRLGQSLLLARRLVDAGVTYVVVNTGREGSWDTHSNNFTQLKDVLLPPMDRGVAALLRDLDERGTLDDVLVLVAGEMGRTPVVNASAGRDHWTTAYSVFLAGGGLTRGQVLGSTTADGHYPASRPITVHDILATVYHRLGIDPHAVLMDPVAKPVAILPDGEPIAELQG
jgi:hypothetical protein